LIQHGTVWGRCTRERGFVFRVWESVIGKCNFAGFGVGEGAARRRRRGPEHQQGYVRGILLTSSSVSYSKIASGSNTGGSGPILSFSGDAEDMSGEGEDVAVDLFADAVNRIACEEAEEADGDEEGDEAEPEDDFNAAWEVLDLARAIYDKGKDEDDEVKLKLADTYITLGDISLETGAPASIIS